jgi:integrase
MPKISPVLTNVAVNRLNHAGWHPVGGVAGLLLQIRKPTREGAAMPRSWILRIRANNKRLVMGLGSYPQVSLSDAREQGKKLVADARQGVDLKMRKRSIRSAALAAAAKSKTFTECAESYIEAHTADYSSDKHRKQWEDTLKSYVYPLIGDMLVADVAMRNILDVLEQQTSSRNGSSGKFWHTKTETAKRVLGRIKVVFDYAIVNEYRVRTNPAIWKGYLDTQLPSPQKISPQVHHPAVPYAHMGGFMPLLRQNVSISAKALEFLILTAVRSGSVRLANWSEIDFKKKLWIIPAGHTKTRQEHRVPLSSQSISLLQSLPRIAGSTVIFPSVKGACLSDMAMSQLMRGMRDRGELNCEGVPHGFRSTFRDWAADQTNYSDEIRMVSSGHTVGDAVKQAYQRTDLLEKRRNLMADWGAFLD